MTIDGYTPWQVLWMIGADLAVLAVIHALIGGPAPRWPDRWLTRDVGPLHFSTHACAVASPKPS